MTEATKPGRARDTDLTQRILAAAEEQLRSRGLEGFQIERIATAVGCGKTAIYRRWASRQQLAAAVIMRSVSTGDQPDTGSVVEDLVIHQEQSISYQDYMSQKRGEHSLAALLVDHEILSYLGDEFLSIRRQNGRAIIGRGVNRGELPPDSDADTILDMLAGMAQYRMTVRKQPLSRELFRSVSKAICSSPPLHTS